MKDRDSVSLGIWFNVGGRYEEKANKGAAHFLEHIVFKGSRHYSCEKIKQTVEGVGGSLNAFTAEEQTCFYAKTPSKHLRSAFDVLADMVFFPRIQARDVAKEKTVIIEEIKMYRDLPQYHVMEQLDGMVWPGHPLGQSIAGTIESVGRTTREDLRDFHRNYYGPSNALIAACGNVDHDTLKAMAVSKLSKVSCGKSRAFKAVQSAPSQAQLKIEKRKIEQKHLALGMRAFDQHSHERFALALLNVILGGNMSSRLFVEVREKHGLAYSISSSVKLLDDTGMFMVRAGVDNTRLVKALELIVKELEKICRSGVKENEFKRARDYLLGQLVLGLEDTMEHMLWMGESVMIRERIRTLKEIISRFKKVPLAQIKKVAKEVLKPSCFNLSLVGPVSDAQRKRIRTLIGVPN